MSDPRDKLRMAPPGSRRRAINRWFDTHPGARDFVESWRKMSEAGETDWSMRAVHRELQSEHAFPFHLTTLWEWLRGTAA